MNVALMRGDLDRIAELEAQIEALRERYPDPELFGIYSQAVAYQLERIQARVREQASFDVSAADVWIRLTGPAIGTGSGSLETITAFMERFRIAAKHAVSALEGVPYTGGRFVGSVEAATNFQLVATAPGSFQIGLSSAVARVADNPLEGELFELAAVNAAIAEAQRERAVGMAGVRVVIESLGAADDGEKLAVLRKLLDDHGLLRVLYHARNLFPRGIDGVEFYGPAIHNRLGFRADVRDRLRELGEKLVEAERYVSGVGVVQMMDLANRTVRIDFASIADLPEMSSVRGEYGEEWQEKVAKAGGKPVFFSGSLRFDPKGQPQRVAIDYLDLLEGESAESAPQTLGLPE